MIEKTDNGEGVARIMEDFSNRAIEKDIIQFVEHMGRYGHRTIQQKFTHIVMEWVKYLSTLKEGEYDARNEASVLLAKEIMAKVDERKTYLPCI